MAGFDRAEEGTWRHLDTCQFETHLHAEIPRVQCPTHGVFGVGIRALQAQGKTAEMDIYLSPRRPVFYEPQQEKA